MAHDHPLPVEGTLSFYHFAAGVRLMPADRRHAVPFVQLLAGAADATARSSTNPKLASTDAVWGPMLQPGLGVSVPLNHFVSLVGHGDYRIVIFRGQFDNEVRLSFGARFMLW